ncbi:MAG: sialidase family protein [Bryobacterales bacterium]|nr:sialidase family protein [Bryobacterales bacterium]
MSRHAPLQFLAIAVLMGAVACTAGDEGPAIEAATPEGPRHLKVYFEKEMFGGWPANHGIWSWGDEILVGFGMGHYKEAGLSHHIDREKPEVAMLARSLDGGETWVLEDPGAQGYLLTEGGYLHGVTRPGVTLPDLREPEGGVDFTHPDFALTVRTNSIHAGIGRTFYSYDRGRTWDGPFRLPNFDAPGIAPRTDYIVDSKDQCTLFITAAKSNGREGRPLCVRTTDGGKTWTRLAWIGPEPEEGFSIMPASVRLSEAEILVTVRMRDDSRRWIGAYLSSDDGASWEYLGEAVPDAGVGNPPAMIQLEDGRICLIYGYRAEPFSIRARLSSDQGRTWSDDIVLRDDGASRDIGYPRAVQRTDGKVVTVYYFTDEASGPERYIGATIWTPPSP